MCLSLKARVFPSYSHDASMSYTHYTHTIQFIELSSKYILFWVIHIFTYACLGCISHFPMRNFPSWYYVQMSLFSNQKNFLCGSKEICAYSNIKLPKVTLSVPHGAMKPPWPWYVFIFSEQKHGMAQSEPLHTRPSCTTVNPEPVKKAMPVLQLHTSYLQKRSTDSVVKRLKAMVNEL